MSKNKSAFNISKLVQQQKSKDLSDSKPVNLEALINSGRVRIEDKELKNISNQKRK